MLCLVRALNRFGIRSVNKMESSTTTYKFYDIAANITSEQFFGQYHSKNVHPPDVDEVIKRASSVGCDHLLIAAGSIEDARKSYQLCQKSEKFYMTIGVHPCRASEPFNKNKYPSVDAYFQELQTVLQKVRPKLVAIGECGLDYDRLNYASKEQMLQIFPRHFNLAQKYKLPMYLHNRNTGNDFFDIVRKNRNRFSTGVVHSFTGSLQELKTILELDLYVGINGCSLKTEDNLKVLEHIPLDKIMLETDCPYCDIRTSHAGSKFVKTKLPQKAKQKHSKQCMVKGRNEPCNIIQVLQVVSGVLKIDPKQLSEHAYNNSIKLLTL